MNQPTPTATHNPGPDTRTEHQRLSEMLWAHKMMSDRHSCACAEPVQEVMPSGLHVCCSTCRKVCKADTVARLEAALSTATHGDA